MTESNEKAQAASWTDANLAYLESGMQRVKLLLHRRVLWLRRCWKDDSLGDYRGLVISDAQADRLLASGGQEEERRFRCEDAEALELRERARQARKEMDSWAATMAETGTPPALEILASLFDLGEFERGVLLLTLASELVPGFDRLVAYAQDDATRKLPTLLLAQTLLDDDCTSPQVARGALLPESPLRRLHLLSLEPASEAPMTAAAIRLDPRIADYLQGMNLADERIAAATSRIDGHPPVTRPQEDLAERLEALLRAPLLAPGVPAVNLLGAPGVGRRAVARILCERLGLDLRLVNPLRLPPAGPERIDLLRILEREAALLPTAYYVDCSELEAGHEAPASAVGDLLEELPGLVFLASRDRWNTARHLLAVHVPKPDASDQLRLWKSALADSPAPTEDACETGLAAIAEQFDFGPATIRKAVRTGGELARMRESGSSRVTPEDIWDACRAHATQSMNGLARRLTPRFTWDDIVLSPTTLAQLHEISAQVTHRPEVYETWGFGAKLGRARGISALFAGGSGTGKTMAAEILAHDLKLDLYRIDLSTVVSKYIGETEKNLRRAFDTAEQAGAILFFDEADALFGKRTEIRDSHDRYANIEVAYLLQRMEDYRGLAILATNKKSYLDEAFLRRLRFLVDFPFPDLGSRREIWRKAFPPAATTEDLDFAALARLEIAGGNIQNVAINAAFLAAKDNVAIRMTHIMEASRREYAKINRLVLESEFGSYYL